MKVLKVLGVLIAALGISGLAVAFILPARLKVEHTVKVTASAPYVYDNVQCLNMWKVWMPWGVADSTFSYTYSENACGTGASASWASSQTGNASLDIVESNTNEYVRMAIVSEEFGRAEVELALRGDGNGTLVTWKLLGDKVPLLKRPFLVAEKSSLEDKFVYGLGLLKSFSEDQYERRNDYQAVIRDLPKWPCFVERGEVEPEKIDSFLESAYSKADAIAVVQGVEVNPGRLAVIHNWGQESVLLSAITPILDVSNIKDSSTFQEVEIGKIVKVDHYGSLKKISDAHYFLQNYISENNLEVTGSATEIYTIGSHTEPDTSKWFTTIAYPIR